MFDIKILHGTKRIGEIHTVSSIRYINTKLKDIGEEYSNSPPLYSHERYYVIWINGLETCLHADECEIIQPINLQEFI